MGIMGFGCRWMRWMKACVISSSMSVLVNESPTKDFKVERGLQKNILCPFPVFLLAEGLTGILQNVIRLGSWHNLWTIKAVSRGFELASSVSIYFSKSKVIDLNLKQGFLEAASTFLACDISIVPFRFFGILVGADPRRHNTWMPFLDKLRNWIQWDFLCGGDSEKRKMAWISLWLVCKPKDQVILYGGDILTLVGVLENKDCNWFSNKISCKIDNGYSIECWRNKWLGSSSFRRLFPLIFTRAAHEKHKVSTMGDWADNAWILVVKLQEDRLLQVDEEAQLESLLSILQDVQLN
ncbi:uncharacterized protein LOC131655143 [Vicia villosa]|uniref:uncharacterized protein LOC131655143 n=1 Tax=Vicia villosa TaxID=3911 RepID=UPI00273B558A|nr:uncharacterized protein LOC131655143 [Vicia villosa]